MSRERSVTDFDYLEVAEAAMFAMRGLRDAVCEVSQPYEDHRGRVGNLTEAALRISLAIDDVAEALNRIADAMEDRNGVVR